MTTLITVIHIITCFLLVLVIMIQSGKGAEISASFAGSSQTVFGSSGGANFFVRFTQGAALVFFVTSLSLTVLKSENKRSVFEQVGAGSSSSSAPVNAPAVPAQQAPQPANPAIPAQTPPAKK